MPRDLDIESNFGFALHVNDFMARVRTFPAFGSEVFTVVVEILDVRICNGWAYVGESPGDPLIMADNDKGIARKRHARDIEITGSQVCFVPQVRHLVSQMHIVREQRFARDCVRSGYDPVIRSQVGFSVSHKWLKPRLQQPRNGSLGTYRSHSSGRSRGGF